MTYNDIQNASDAYWWVYDHPAMQYDECMSPWIELTPHMVNPADNTINKDHSLNTKLEWWIECGPRCWDEDAQRIGNMHEWDLDCGGDTAEDAVLTLAKLVFEKYGDYA